MKTQCIVVNINNTATTIRSYVASDLWIELHKINHEWKCKGALITTNALPRKSIEFNFKLHNITNFVPIYEININFL